MSTFGKFFNWSPALLWAFLIFFQSSNPSPAGINLAPDYLLHFAAFGILAFFLAYAFAGGINGLIRGKLSRRSALFSVVISTLYGFSDEWHQSFVPGRHSSWSDIAADFLGALAAVVILMSWKAFVARRENG